MFGVVVAVVVVGLGAWCHLGARRNQNKMEPMIKKPSGTNMDPTGNQQGTNREPTWTQQGTNKQDEI